MLALFALPLLLIAGLFFVFDDDGDDDDAQAAATDGQDTPTDPEEQMDIGSLIEGGEEDDVISGTVNADSLSGNAGDDIIEGLAGDDKLSGGTGSNVMDGGEGDDRVRGGADDDLLIDHAGADTMFGYDGDDTIASAGLFDSVEALGALKGTTETPAEGESFADFAGQFTGDTVDESITDDEGDVIDAGPGDDVILAGKGDTVTGGAGADGIVYYHIGGEEATEDDPVVVTDFDPAEDAMVISYGSDSASDPVIGEDANGNATISIDGSVVTVLQGVTAQDLQDNAGTALAFVDRDTSIVDDPTGIVTEGTEANETIEGSALDDSLAGNDGDDVVDGQAGDDRLSGNKGDNVLYGDEGDDRARGGADEDVIVDIEGSDTLIGYAGDDVIHSAGLFDADAWIADVKAGLTPAEGETLADAAAGLISPDDYSIVDATGDLIDAGPGNDQIFAGPGDTVTGGEGADVLFASDVVSDSGPVIMTDFDPSEDVLTLNYDVATATGSPVAVEDADGNTAIQLDGVTLVTLQGVALADFQANVGTGFVVLERDSGGDNPTPTPVDPIVTEGTDAGETLVGTDSADNIGGNGGDDIVIGKAGDDRLSGDKGDNVLVGGEGNDHMRGGAYEDLFVDTAGVDTIVGYAGDDIVESSGLFDAEAFATEMQTNGVTPAMGQTIAEAAAAVLTAGAAGTADATGDLIDTGFGNDVIYAGGGDAVTTGAGGDAIVTVDSLLLGNPMVVTDFDPANDTLFLTNTPAENGAVTLANVDGNVEISAGGSLIATLQGTTVAAATPAITVQTITV